MFYALIFKDGAGFWAKGGTFTNRDIPKRMMEIALKDGKIPRTDIAIIARWSEKKIQENIDRMNQV